MKNFKGSKDTLVPGTLTTHELPIIRKNHSGSLVLAATLLSSQIASASVEGSLEAVQTKLVGTILPLAAICGLVMAGFSFVMGHPNARARLGLAIVGAIVGFGAESIVAFIRALIH